MTVWQMSGNRFARHLPSFLPAGRPLSSAEFDRRHLGLLMLLWVHVPGLMIFTGLRGAGLTHMLVEGAPIAVFAAAATLASGQRARSAAVALGLVASSSVLVHVWDGAIEGHFHFFVVMAFLALYQSWLPFLTALAFIVVEHGVVGVVAPEGVYNHASGAEHPWRWALIHASFVLAACLGNVIAWQLTEDEATHDSLTGLANRSLFLSFLERRFASRRAQIAVLLLNLDDFKDANDGFGHHVGDGLLVAVGERLGGRLRPGDLLARLGGDEFAIVLQMADAADAEETAAYLLAAFDTPFHVDGVSVAMSASAGVATAGHASSPASMLRDADLAMYESKQAGGGICTTATPALHAAALQRTALLNALPGALRRGEFVVHYQPLYSIDTGATIGVEALVRWQHPTRGLVPPSEFIPVAEQTGFITALGEYVLRTACEQAAAWRALFPDHPEFYVSVNLAPRQLAESDVVATVAAVLAETGLHPRQLCLEVTESAVIGDFDETVPKLRALSALGVRVALDDFGTGFSSLSYLLGMPVDVLKVDRSFVNALADDKGTAIVGTVVDLAHQLGLTVTAEGIETVEQQEILRALQCETGQGYLRAKPGPADAITSLLHVERAPVAVPAPRSWALHGAHPLQPVGQPT